MLEIQEEGLTTQAMQLGGVGLLMTMLIVCVPPKAALFLNGTIGSFMTYSAFSSNAQSSANAASRAMPQISADAQKSAFVNMNEGQVQLNTQTATGARNSSAAFPRDEVKPAKID